MKNTKPPKKRLKRKWPPRKRKLSNTARWRIPTAKALPPCSKTCTSRCHRTCCASVKNYNSDREPDHEQHQHHEHDANDHDPGAAFGDGRDADTRPQCGRLWPGRGLLWRRLSLHRGPATKTRQTTRV